MCLCAQSISSSFPIEILNDCSQPNYNNNDSSSETITMPIISICNEEDNNITIQEDETCFLLSIEMPNVNEKDVEISLKKNVLTISGYRRIRGRSYSSSSSTTSDDEEDEWRRRSNNNTSTKRQRLSRQLEIADPNAIDFDRAMASTWNGCYTLYAPKRRPQVDMFC